jgi:APA family basic amino acid/polyamine antiporter
MNAAAARPLGLWSATALVVGNMIGSGVFLLPASLAPYGAASLLGWIVSIIGALLLAIVFADLGRRYPISGGPYTFSRIAFGDFVGFMMAWCYWVSVWCATAAIAIAFAGSLSVLAPAWFGTPTRTTACALSVLWLCTACNLAGLRTAGLAQLIVTILKLLPLLALVAVGATALDMQAFKPFNPSGQSLLDVTTASAALALWAMLGLECATIPAEHVANAERTIPRATLLGVAIAAVITVAACTIAQGLVPLNVLMNSSAPFADVARNLSGEFAAKGMAVAMAVSCLGALNGWILIQGQIPFAAARDGVFPSLFSKVDAQGTPRIGLVIGSLLASALVGANFDSPLVSVFTVSILLATGACLLPYAATAAAFWWLDIRKKQPTIWRQIVSLLAFLFSALALIGACKDPEVLRWGTYLLVAGLPVYVWVKRSAIFTTNQNSQ